MTTNSNPRQDQFGTTAIEGNPWKGVVPYTDDAEDLRQHPFHGRDKAIEELIEVIDNNEITTFYGKSGIGKSSLIRAGLFPMLLQYNCHPIYIKLQANEINFATQITQRLEEESIVYSRESVGNDSQCPDNDPAYLWDFFANHSFLKEGKPVLPVIVLDQFEESLRYASDRSVALLRQLRVAKQEDLRNDGTRFEVNYRFVISLREDDLFLLEDAIDQNFIDRMKTGRYRLQPIDAETAKSEIIFIPEAEDRLYGEDKEKVANALLQYATRSTQDKSVSSIMLSLVCSMAYEAARGGRITLDVVKKLTEEDPLITFYKQSIKDIHDQGFIEFLESEFVDGDRKRTVFEREIASNYLDNVKKLADEQNDRRILTKASTNGSKEVAYELLHDRIAEAIGEYRKLRDEERRQAQAKKMRKTLLLSVAGLAILALTYIAALYISKRPLFYNYAGDIGGDAVPVKSRPYYVKDSILILSNCRVDPYTFYGNREVRKLVIDDVNVSEKGLYLPNADTIVIGPRQWQQFTDYAAIAPNASVFVAKRPCHNGTITRRENQKLENVIIADADTAFLQWDEITGTLWARSDSNGEWSPGLLRSNYAYYIVDSASENNYSFSDPLYKFDIATKTLKYEENKRYVLVNSDPSIRALHQGDIPLDILKHTNIAYLPYIDSICDEALQNMEFILNIQLPDAHYIGKKAFVGMNSISQIRFPRVRRVSDSAFFDVIFDSLLLDSVQNIGRAAFADKEKWRKKSKRVWLPMIDTCADSAFLNKLDDQTIVQYNPAVSSVDRFLRKQNNTIQTSDEKIQANGNFQGYHFSAKQDSLIIDSSYIKMLSIPNETRHFIIKTQEPFSVDKIKVGQYNSLFFVWRGDLYYKKSKGQYDLYISCNKSTLVSPPQNVGVYYNKNNTIPRCRKYICINRSRIVPHAGINTNGVDLYVPYGQSDYYKDFSKDYNSVKELSWVQTQWYRLFYSKVKDLALAGTYVTTDDIWTFLVGLVAMVLMLIAAIKLKWKRWCRWTILDAVVLLTILLFFIYVVSPFGWWQIGKCYTTSDGSSFYSIYKLIEHLETSDSYYSITEYKEWPALCFALPLWALYLLTTRIRKKRR